MAPRSRIQKQVLNLYKELLNITKPQPSLSEYIQEEFRRNAKLPKTDTIKIEYLLRRGWRQLDMLKTSSVSGGGVFEKEADRTNRNKLDKPDN